jgi:hypothetical protein
MSNRNAVEPEVIPWELGLRIMGISKPKGERLIREKSPDFLHPFRIGRRRVYRAGDVSAWLERRAREAQPHGDSRT